MTSLNRTFHQDLKAMLEAYTRWQNGKPEIKLKWDKKVYAFAKRSASLVMVRAPEDRISKGGIGPSTGWLHTLSGGIEIMTNVSKERFGGLVQDVTSILQDNVVRGGYMDINVMAVHDTSDEMRKEWRAVVDVEARMWQ